MKNHELLDALGHLDPKYVKEADARAEQQSGKALETVHSEPPKKPIYRILSGIAAAVMVGTVTAAGFSVIRRLDRAQAGSSAEVSAASGQDGKNILGGTGNITAVGTGLFADDTNYYLGNMFFSKAEAQAGTASGGRVCQIPDCDHTSGTCAENRLANLYSDGQQLYSYNAAGILYLVNSYGDTSFYEDIAAAAGIDTNRQSVQLDCIQRIPGTDCSLISIQTEDAYISYFRFDSGEYVFPEALRCPKNLDSSDLTGGVRLNYYIGGKRDLYSGGYSLMSGGVQYDAESRTAAVDCTLIPSRISSFVAGHVKLYFRLGENTAEELTDSVDAWKAMFCGPVTLDKHTLYSTENLLTGALEPLFSDRHIVSDMACVGNQLYFVENGKLCSANADGTGITEICSAELILDASYPGDLVLADFEAENGKESITEADPEKSITRIYNYETGELASFRTPGKNGAFESYTAQREVDAVTVSVKEGSVRPDGMTVTVNNQGSYRWYTGRYMLLEDNEEFLPRPWELFGGEIPDRENAMTPDSLHTLDMDWKDSNGNLLNGKYLIIMEFWNYDNDSPDYAELHFTVNNGAEAVNAMITVSNVTETGCTLTITNYGKQLIWYDAYWLTDETGLFVYEGAATDTECSLTQNQSYTAKITWDTIPAGEYLFEIPVYAVSGGEPFYLTYPITI